MAGGTSKQRIHRDFELSVTVLVTGEQSHLVITNTRHVRGRSLQNEPTSGVDAFRAHAQRAGKVQARRDGVNLQLL